MMRQTSFYRRPLSSTRQRMLAQVLLVLGSLLWVSLSSAQLATRHYLPPVAAYADSDVEIQISTPSTADVNYTIRSGLDSGALFSNNASMASISGTVTKGSPQVHDFLRGTTENASGALGRTLTETPAVVEDYGIIVEADVAVTVIMSALRSNNRSIIAGKGDNGVGTDFYAWSAFNTTGNTVSSINDSVHFISVMALEDGTEVTIDSTNTFQNFDHTGGPILLDAFETFTFATPTSTSLTGTHITSTLPITVTSGDAHPQQPGPNERDGGVDQLVPTRLAGTHYALGNIAPHNAYGSDDAGGQPVGNRYVQIVTTEDNTTIRHYRSADGSSADYVVANAGDTLVLRLDGTTGDGHFFTSTNLNPFLLFINSSGEPANEMGGAAVPALRGRDSVGSFCSGIGFTEFTAPDDASGFMVYIPTDQLASLELDIGDGFVPWEDGTIGAPTSQTEIDPDGAGVGQDELTFLLFPGDLVAAQDRIAFQSSGRMHVAVGTADAGQTGSFGYFSDYNFGFNVNDPVLHVPTDAYVEPQTFADATPRAITHCIDVDSACSRLYSIHSDISSDRGGSFSNITTNASVDDADPCFDFTPVPVVGAGPQDYIVTATIEDETGATRDVDIHFTFTWLDSEADAIPDALDLDDDNDGILDADELGGLDLSGDADLDQISDYIDVDFVGPGASGAGTSAQPDCVDVAPADGECDAVPAAFDFDGDGVANHRDLDSDADGVWDLIEGNDANQDGENDLAAIVDADNDGVIDAVVDADTNGVDDAYDGAPAAKQDSDSDTAPDYLDPDDDDDGLNTADENYNGGDPTDDDTDTDGTPDYLDTESDGDGVADSVDIAPGNPLICADTDLDSCDDCSAGGGVAPLNDGLDTDLDGVCNAGDVDDDNDGVEDGDDDNSINANICADGDLDSCDDCSITGADGSGGSVTNDGDDYDGDGICDAGDSDDDNDGVADATDDDPLDPAVCADADNDSCDDCSVTQDDGSGGDVADDGDDLDSDGLCDAGDDDDDGDGVDDVDDDDATDPTICTDADNDSCDDCSITGANGSGGDVAGDGPDADSDGICDAGDPDDDNDGVDDTSDDDALDPAVCADADNDGCDDCSVTQDNGSGGDVNNDGDDADVDGICDLTDDDADNDGVADDVDLDPNDPNICADTDNDSCDDCVNTGADHSGGDVADDGTDLDADGLCDAGDDDVDGDGVENDTDLDPIDPNICADVDLDSCDDCTRTGADGSGGDPADDGPDADANGYCDAAPDNDGDGIPDSVDADDDNDGIDDVLEGSGDFDGDGIQNKDDLDADGDGVFDVVEGGVPGLDADGDGVIDDDTDADGDGLFDVVDNDASSASGAASSFVPRDTDGDSDQDYLDVDDDDDGILTEFEDVDGDDDPTNDDTDDDGTPNFLDDDDDGDGLLTIDENADPNADGDPDDALSTVTSGIPDYLNPEQLDVDSDNDGILDSVECPDGTEPDSDDDGDPDCFDSDDDNDGVPTRDERPSGDEDTDGDGTPDHLDPDDDGDGLPTLEEFPRGDSDGDGIPDYLDPDDDDDGVPTVDEAPRDDTDNDGIPDFLDTDDDGDGTDTRDELADEDGDGTPDYLEGEGGDGSRGDTDGPEDSAATLLGGGFGCTVSGSGQPGSGALWLFAGLGLLVFASRRRERRAARQRIG